VTTTDEPTVEAPPEDGRRRSLLETLQDELGDAVVGSELARNDLWVRVDRRAWRRAAELCRDRLGMTYFCFLSAIDWMPNPDLLGEKEWESEDAPVVTDDAGDEDDDVDRTEQADPAAPVAGGAQGPATGVAGGDSRFQVLARVYNVNDKVGITLKADLDPDDPRIETLSTVWRGADWHERECWEMFGFQFEGHPGLRHLYLPQEFEGHPLRKDFPLLARLVKPWPGLVDVEPMPGEPAGEGEEAAEEA
jgi:NADH-quinone oxidoreductase subunit C